MVEVERALRSPEPSRARERGARRARRHVLEVWQIVKRPRREVFAFFSEPANLDTITPDDLRFEIETPRPIAMRTGALIAYRLRLAGIPFRWLTRVEAFEPEERFVDVQVRGPYRRWRHTHEFVEIAEGTLIRDRVEYELPFGPLGELAHVIFVRARLRGIFAHRRRRIAELLGSSALATRVPLPAPAEVRPLRRAARRVLTGLACVALCFLPGAVGAVTRPGAWYQALAKPALTPPGWIFPVVWTALYLAMGLALFAFLDARERRPPRLPLAAFGAQLALNGLWSWLFFGLHRPGLALADVAALGVLVFACAVAFWRRRPIAGALLVPYVAWVGFAAYLNAGVWVLNR